MAILFGGEPDWQLPVGWGDWNQGRTGRPWIPAEDQQLINLACVGLEEFQWAMILYRSEEEVRGRMAMLDDRDHGDGVTHGSLDSLLCMATNQ